MEEVCPHVGLAAAAMAGASYRPVLDVEVRPCLQKQQVANTPSAIVSGK